jgi:peroxiredoxin family protein
MASDQKKVAFIAAHGGLDWGYPPFILASAAAAMDMEVQIFFTFYGLPLLKKKIDMKVTPVGNPTMPMKMPFGPRGFQSINWPIPNFLTGNIPFFDSIATGLMKKTFKKNGVASLQELRDVCQDCGVKFIACQMTMDVFGFKKEEFVDGIEIGGAATFLDYASEANIQMFL